MPEHSCYDDPEAGRQMEQAIVERLPEIVLEPVADFIAQGVQGRTQ